jgi:AdoMet-dependent rRNA methyltransferase SPB1
MGKSSAFPLSSLSLFLLKLQLLEKVTQGDMSAADTFLSDLPRDDIYVSDAEEDDDTSLDSDLDPEELAGVMGHQGLKDQKW